MDSTFSYFLEKGFMEITPGSLVSCPKQECGDKIIPAVGVVTGEKNGDLLVEHRESNNSPVKTTAPFPKDKLGLLVKDCNGKSNVISHLEEIIARLSQDISRLFRWAKEQNEFTSQLARDDYNLRQEIELLTDRLRVNNLIQ